MESIQELPHEKEKWEGIKSMRQERQPRFIHMKDIHGAYVAPRDRAEAIASYLELKHWSNEVSVPLTRCDIIQDLSHVFNAGSFTFHEFEEALRLAKMKTNNRGLTISPWSCLNGWMQQIGLGF